MNLLKVVTTFYVTKNKLLMSNLLAAGKNLLSVTKVFADAP